MINKILYVDLDNVMVNFQSGIDKLDNDTIINYEGRLDEVPHIFSMMDPVEDAIESYELLCKKYDTYILSTSPWENPTAWHDKLNWVKNNIGLSAYKRLILTHNKHLNRGDYLIDDRLKNGADRFQGELIHFLSDRFPNWKSVINYLL